MVKSGLEQEIIDTRAVPRVSQYRLAAHLSAALALYVGMLHTALSLRRDFRASTDLAQLQSLQAALSRPEVRRYGRIAALAGIMVFLTAVSGAFVAGLDAGLVYNEFPTMGGRLVPPTDELMDPRYAKRSDGTDRWWRNMLENPVTAQFDHRLFVSTTLVFRRKLTSTGYDHIHRPTLPPSPSPPHGPVESLTRTPLFNPPRPDYGRSGHRSGHSGNHHPALPGSYTSSSSTSSR